MSEITLPPYQRPQFMFDPMTGKPLYTAEQMQERDRQVAALVRAQVLEECTVAIESAILRLVDPRQTASECLDAIRGMKSDPGHSATADACASTAPLPEGEPSLLETVQQLRALTPGPTVEANSQHWSGMDGAIAWHLIDRHADNWADIGQMMNEWLAANAVGWIPVSERLPEIGTECLVFKTSPWVDGPYIAFDRWDEQYEAPVSFSSATISVGVGWGEADFNEVTHWMPKPAAPRCRSADNVSPGPNEQDKSASPSVLLIRGEK